MGQAGGCGFESVAYLLISSGQHLKAQGGPLKYLGSAPAAAVIALVGFYVWMGLLLPLDRSKGSLEEPGQGRKRRKRRKTRMRKKNTKINYKLI